MPRREVFVFPSRSQSSSRRPSALLAIAALAVGLATVVVACSGASGSPSMPPSASPGASGVAPSAAGSGTPTPITKLTVGLGYIPSVQFAQFYYADQRGYYRDAGLDVTFQNKIDPDLIALTGQGAVDIALADGTSLIPAVSQGIPVRYCATIYAKFPNVVFAKASSGIRTAADLKGRRIGIPGKYGSGWIMLQALLGSAGLTTADVDLIPYPDYGQLAGVEQGAVDAATGFANNEPVQLQLSGSQPVVLTVDRVVALPGNGLIVGSSTLAAKHDALKAFVDATLRAMAAIEADPQLGLDAAITAVPELASGREAQLAILQATIDGWQGPLTAANGLGAIDRAGWDASISFLAGLPGGLVPNPVTTDRIVTEELLPAH
jgi:NitT/TauT family transport system substrate-binding protein